MGYSRDTRADSTISTSIIDFDISTDQVPVVIISRVAPEAQVTDPSQPDVFTYSICNGHKISCMVQSKPDDVAACNDPNHTAGGAVHQSSEALMLNWRKMPSKQYI